MSRDATLIRVSVEADRFIEAIKAAYEVKTGLRLQKRDVIDKIVMSVDSHALFGVTVPKAARRASQPAAAAPAPTSGTRPGP